MPIKIVLLGNENVGKSVWLKSIIDNIDCSNQKYTPTIPVEYHDLNYHEKKFHFWDTPGNKRFNSILDCYMKETDIFILFYDTTHTDSLSAFVEYAKKIKQYIQTVKPHIILLGTKYNLANKSNVNDIEIDSYKEAVANEIGIESTLIPHVVWGESTKDGIGDRGNFLALLDKLSSEVKSEYACQATTQLGDKKIILESENTPNYFKRYALGVILVLFGGGINAGGIFALKPSNSCYSIHHPTAYGMAIVGGIGFLIGVAIILSTAIQQCGYADNAKNNTAFRVQ